MPQEAPANPLWPWQNIDFKVKAQTENSNEDQFGNYLGFYLIHQDKMTNNE